MAKKLLVLFGACALGLLALEVAAPLVYWRYTARPFERAALQAQLRHGAAPSETTPSDEDEHDPRVADQRVMLHPYFGYVAAPDLLGVNQFGFFGREPFAIRSPDTLIVAVLGGSVADQLVKRAGDRLTETLRHHPKWRHRQVELINLALGGFKEPQQMLTLATLLALGAQFDVVINLDGFNEIDGAKDNQQDGVNPFFPYTWNLHARQGFDRAALPHLVALDAAEQRRVDLRRWFDRWPLRQSAFALTLWSFLDAGQEATLRRETAELRSTLAAGHSGPQQTGPRVEFPDEDAMYREYVEVWARASMELRAICDAFGIRYFHFLQPNQYLPGSKTLTPEEDRIAFDSDIAGSQRIATAFPMMRERGRELVEQGVDFTDLTMLFVDERRSVYEDNCCHLNDYGNQRLAEAVGAAVAP